MAQVPILLSFGVFVLLQMIINRSVDVFAKKVGIDLFLVHTNWFWLGLGWNKFGSTQVETMALTWLGRSVRRPFQSLAPLAAHLSDRPAASAHDVREKDVWHAP